MTTLEKIEFDGVSVIEKAARGESLTHDDKIVLRAYTQLHGKTAGNAGKRKDKFGPQKQRISH